MMVLVLVIVISDEVFSRVEVVVYLLVVAPAIRIFLNNSTKVLVLALTIVIF